MYSNVAIKIQAARKCLANAPGMIRTCDLCLRRAALYPLSYGRRGIPVYGRTSLAAVPLYLSEADVASLVTPAEAVPVLEECFRRMAAGEVENVPRLRPAVPGGLMAGMSASDVD